MTLRIRVVAAGISRCASRSKMLAALWRPRGRRRPLRDSPAARALLRRGCSNGSSEAGGIASGRVVDQSFTAAHRAPDGRTYQFATVVVRAMRRAESPAPVWDQACALIGGLPPTLAVAFVSKPTESALRTLRALGLRLSASVERAEAERAPPLPISEVSPGEEGSAGEQPCAAESPAVPSCQASPSVRLSSPFTPSQPKLLECTATAADGRQTVGDIGGSERGRRPVPFVGCVLEDLSGDLESGDEGGRSISLQGSSRGSGLGMARGEFHASGENDGRYGFRSSGAFDMEEIHREEAEDEDEATLSDWEGCFRDYGDEAVKLLDSRPENDEEGEVSANGTDEKVSKEGLVGFLNALVRFKNPREDSEEGGDLRQSDNGKPRATLKDRQEKLQDAFGSSRMVPQCGPMVSHGRLAIDSLFGDVEGTVTVETKDDCDGTGDRPGSDSEKGDGNYKLILCVGHMPGAKAFSFHSSTTGIPRLPDLENAVLENNPHMLLLGAPGFVFPDLIQRLSSLFPASCRAGAFLAPLFTSKRSQWTGVATEAKPPCPLFFGTQFSTSGVVGLAVSSQDGKSAIPVGAFAEFARMSVGMPRIRGYIFLDEAISTNLFLPKNVSLGSSHGSLKGSGGPASSSSVLNQLRKRLLQESAGPWHPNDSPVERSSNHTTEDLAASGLPEDQTKAITSQLLSSGPQREEIESLERLPLALLDAVLFPGWSMPFYIYEPCYRAMVRQCVEQGKPFGLSSMYSGFWAAGPVEAGEVIGTIANLKVHSFERDCRSYIIAHGIRRFRVVNERMWSEPGAFGLTMGQVQFFDDKICETVEQKEELLQLAQRAVSLCCEVTSEHVQSSPGLGKSAHDPRLASFAIGHLLNVPTRVKRRWLKMVNTKARLLEQITFLEAKLPARP